MFFLLLLCTGLRSSAQHSVGSLTWQPKVGLNVANVSGSSGSSRVGLVAGVEAEWQVKAKLSLAAALLYSQQGCKVKAGSYQATHKFDYINIPLVVNFYVARDLALKVGLQPAFNVNATVRSSLNGYTGTAKEGGMETFLVEVPLGISYEWQGWVIDARYNWGLSRINKSNDHNSVTQITIGYKFNMK
ncbi:outer membrane beta-barrel protein [Hoylesella enoeca]|uniref:outer membrane beta-barrel protein n=1 Tax=Hoylesella enoeca TaxID=76123 RepID=UPI00288BA86B|nr:outer membrane beta-barrel protein [Hoylesella enoeca]